ncbi:hypothetical protein ACKXGD_14135 [Enterococcus lactis]
MQHEHLRSIQETINYPRCIHQP